MAHPTSESQSIRAQLARKHAALQQRWKHEPPTAAQLSWLRALGCPGEPPATKYEAALLIEQLTKGGGR